ncbi:MAG: winged helix-turn-helix domain-containing protein [Candidatus Nanohaloarchaea archaeon]
MRVEPEEFIGSHAGTVWDALQDGEKTVRQLKEETGLTRREVTLALGWLAREDKVGVRKPGSYYTFHLDGE